MVQIQVTMGLIPLVMGHFHHAVMGTNTQKLAHLPPPLGIQSWQPMIAQETESPHQVQTSQSALLILLIQPSQQISLAILTLETQVASTLAALQVQTIAVLVWSILLVLAVYLAAMLVHWSVYQAELVSEVWEVTPVSGVTQALKVILMSKKIWKICRPGRNSDLKVNVGLKKRLVYRILPSLFALTLSIIRYLGI